jgi:aspartyl-tRNA synthetase
MLRNLEKFANFWFLLRISPGKPVRQIVREGDRFMPTTVTAVPATNLEPARGVIRSFIDAWNTRDFDRFGDLMADNAVLHIAGADIPCDPAGTRAIAEEWTTAFPDWHFDLRALITEGDLIVAHMPYGGTHRHAIAGVPATGRRCFVDEIVIFRIANGRIAEAWEVYDEAGMWRQLGAAPPA